MQYIHAHYYNQKVVAYLVVWSRRSLAIARRSLDRPKFDPRAGKNNVIVTRSDW